MADILLISVMEERIAVSINSLLDMKRKSTLNLNLLRPKVIGFNIGVATHDRCERKLSNLSHGVDEIEKASNDRKVSREFHRNDEAEIALQSEVREALEKSNTFKDEFQGLLDRIGTLKARLHSEEIATILAQVRIHTHGQISLHPNKLFAERISPSRATSLTPPESRQRIPHPKDCVCSLRK